MSIEGFAAYFYLTMGLNNSLETWWGSSGLAVFAITSPVHHARSVFLVEGPLSTVFSTVKGSYLGPDSLEDLSPQACALLSTEGRGALFSSNSERIDVSSMASKFAVCSIAELDPEPMNDVTFATSCDIRGCSSFVGATDHDVSLFGDNSKSDATTVFLDFATSFSFSLGTGAAP